MKLKIAALFFSSVSWMLIICGVYLGWGTVPAIFAGSIYFAVLAGNLSRLQRKND